MNLSPPPDLFLFAQSLRQSVKNDNPINRAQAFALGRGYGLSVKTLAGMADCSESHVRQMLLLLKLPTQHAIAVVQGAPYSPLIQCLRSDEPLPDLPLPERILAPTGS
jgi:hypothetical protein